MPRTSPRGWNLRAAAAAPWSPIVLRASELEQPAGSLSSSVSDSAADRRFLRAVYLDFTGRTPLQQECDAQVGKSRGAVIEGLAGSEVFFRGYYEEELFYFLLLDNFRPSTDVFHALPSRLARRQMSVRDAARTLVSSQFFNARNPGNDTFVTVVLEQLLGMTVQKEVDTLEAGKRMYDGKEARLLGHPGSNQADLVRIAVADERFEPHLLQRKFEAIFGEEPPRKFLKRDAARLRDEPLAYAEILATWVSSAAYEERLAAPRPKTDRQFIRSLFVDLLGREAEYQEFRRCRNALLALSDSAPLRSVVIKLMLDAGEVELPEWNPQDTAASIRQVFLRFLCREPSPDERAAFVAEAQQVAPTTLVRALLTHPEYHVY